MTERAALASDAHAPRIAVVNGLRGVAILWVIYHHLLRDRLTPIFGAPGFVVKRFWVDYHTLFVNGWVGVNLFFVLSGLVLYLPHATGARDMTSWREARAFYGRRARRLLPLYYVSLAIYVLSIPAGDIGSARFFAEVLRLATFAFAFSDGFFMPVLNVALWSLGVEVWFSVVFPLLLVAVKRVGMRWVVAGALVLSLAVRVVAIHAWDGPPAYHLTWKDGLFARLDDFIVGMAFAAWVVQRRRVPGAAFSLITAVLGALFITAGCVLWDNVVVGHVPFVAAAALNDVLLAGIALLLAGMLSNPPAVLRVLLTNRPLQLVGAMCYSLYLWHLVGARIGSDNTASWPLGGMLVYIALVFGLSALSYRFIEFPEKSARTLFLDFPRALGNARRTAQIEHKSAPALGPLETVSEKTGPT